MTRIFDVFSALLILFILSGCGQAYERELSNGYWLWALDSRDDMSLMVNDGK